MSNITDYLTLASDTIRSCSQMENEIAEVAAICVAQLKKGNKIIICGNGGSAADSQHLAAEMMGRFLKDREPLPAIALTVDTSALTAIGNDYGYDQVFSRQLRGIGQSGDVLIGISTSGNSKNVYNAMEAAASLGIITVGMTGSAGGIMQDVADLKLQVPSKLTNHIQECHITIGHLLCKIIEEEIFP